ncbi:MAG: TetR family transcriptional regulator [Actinomycetia bacterium]|nr:TetR family transcriptional regulator [Actinomycetes bacterium]
MRTAVLAATIDILDEDGLAALSIEQVAHRSGVAKTTIYRHWPGKPDLVVDAIGSMHDPMPTPNTGDLHADLRECFHGVRDTELQSRFGRIIPDLLAASQRDPEYAQLHKRLTAERKQPLRTVLELAQLRGQLRADVDLDDAADLLIGPLLARTLLSRTPSDEKFLELIIATVVRGLSPEG